VAGKPWTSAKCVPRTERKRGEVVGGDDVPEVGHAGLELAGVEPSRLTRMSSTFASGELRGHLLAT
jgi:hypothetical protein